MKKNLVLKYAATPKVSMLDIENALFYRLAFESKLDYFITSTNNNFW
jgi:hypothetical protein